MKDQCSFVRANCHDHEDGLLSYLQFYYCDLAGAKPLAIIILVLWLSWLFSTIGIAASDFLCIDLNTLASILGMSESLTGVTFLAFGNGSPDVFSTFAAMKSNSGGLAIGELIGAAGFITSVVAGSMALIRPFRVARRSFVRDLGFFVVAVTFSLFVVADGRLRTWESATMVGLYSFYVVLVVMWHWYLTRRRRVFERDVAARSHYHIPDNQELDIEENADDDDPGVASDPRSSLHGASTDDFDTLERAGVPAWKEGDEDDETRNRYLAEIRENMHVYRPPSRRRNTGNPIRPSLVGALEFQSVLSSLQKSKNIYSSSAISLNGYSDNPDEQPDERSDSAPPSANARMSPRRMDGSSRAGGTSTSDAPELRVDTDLQNQQSGVSQPVHLTVTRSSVDRGSSQAQGFNQGTTSAASPSFAPHPPSQSQSPHLLGPEDAVRSPRHHAVPGSSRSTSHISPRGTTHYEDTSDSMESPASPFPPYVDNTSSTASSIRLPDPSYPQDSWARRDSPFERVSSPPAPTKWWSWMLPSPRSLALTLFPTLHDWKTKSMWGRLLAIVAAPSVLLLTITVPVVEPTQSDAASEPAVEPGPVMVTPANDEADAALVRLPEDRPLIQDLEDESSDHRTTDPTGKMERNRMSSRRRFDSELPAVQPSASPTSPPKEWNRWLVTLQLFTGPFFIVLVGWTSADPDMNARNLVLPSLCALGFSLLCLTTLTFTTRHSRPSQPPGLWRALLALLGFVVAICWIACIATEVVSLLKTLGVILNISDSLLGLTVFAVGNSLGDLVADITVARLGYPVMALSACFGGPMLNILLGIGLGGLYMTLNQKAGTSPPASYDISISKVLLISGATLLATLVGLLVVIPLNHWRMDRRVGFGLIGLWCVNTLSNVFVEIFT